MRSSSRILPSSPGDHAGTDSPGREAALNARAFFRRLYPALWAVLGAGYLLVLLPFERSVAVSIAGALANVAAPAALGTAVPWLSGRIRRLGPGSRRFFLTHLAAGTLFGFSGAAGNVAAFQLLRLVPGLGARSGYSGYVFAWQVFISFLLYSLLAGTWYAADGFLRLAAARELAARAELRALRAQLNPHFLFNTLQSLLSLVRSDPVRAEEALEEFGDLLRYTLGVQKQAREMVSLREEWAFVTSFLALESLRLGDRLRVQREVEEAALDCEVPALCLQPLVENAIRHGIAPRVGGGRLQIRIERREGMLHIEVRDDGPGDRTPRGGGGQGMGLDLVRRRLDAACGPGARLEAAPTAEGGFLARLLLPAAAERRAERTAP